jgi:hypothetical protein
MRVLSTAAINSAVARAECQRAAGGDPQQAQPLIQRIDPEQVPNYTEDWSAAGPIIEREGISLRKEPAGGWYAFKNFSTCSQRPFEHVLGWDAGGSTALLAAMRCYVVSVLGEEEEA